MDRDQHRTVMTTKTTRRQFVHNTLVAGAAVTSSAVTAPMILGREARGANDRIGVGFIGTGGRCNAHINVVNQLKEEGITQPVAVCDVYRPRLQAASQKTGGATMYMEHEALLDDPDVLVLDEPTDGLDPNQKHEVRKLIGEMAPEKAIIISTHILEEVDAVCNRLVIINEGRILEDTTPDELRKREGGTLEEIFRSLTRNNGAKGGAK